MGILYSLWPVQAKCTALAMVPFSKYHMQKILVTNTLSLSCTAENGIASMSLDPTSLGGIKLEMERTAGCNDSFIVLGGVERT